MAYFITGDCIKCGGCANECPTRAISEGKDAYVVDPARCTECLGIGSPACALICPVKAAVTDPARRETAEQLRIKYDALDGGGMMKANREAEMEIIAFIDKYSTRPGGDNLPGCGLDHGGACALGTCVNGRPRVTPVDYHSEGMIIWVMGDPGGKCANLRANPEVSLGIYARFDHTIEHRSLQLWGRVSLFTRASHEQLYMDKMAKHGLTESTRRMVTRGGVAESSPQLKVIMERFLNRETLIRIDPYRAVMLVVPPTGTGRARRVNWHKTIRK
jgi:Pyruvate/2-oxoacid:ferredoxin oxidoreductase delta subunit